MEQLPPNELRFIRRSDKDESRKYFAIYRFYSASLQILFNMTNQVDDAELGYAYPYGGMVRRKLFANYHMEAEKVDHNTTSVNKNCFVDPAADMDILFEKETFRLQYIEKLREFFQVEVIQDASSAAYNGVDVISLLVREKFDISGDQKQIKLDLVKYKENGISFPDVCANILRIDSDGEVGFIPEHYNRFNIDALVSTQMFDMWMDYSNALRAPSYKRHCLNQIESYITKKQTHVIIVSKDAFVELGNEEIEYAGYLEYCIRRRVIKLAKDKWTFLNILVDMKVKKEENNRRGNKIVYVKCNVCETWTPFKALENYGVIGCGLECHNCSEHVIVIEKYCELRRPKTPTFTVV